MGQKPDQPIKKVQIQYFSRKDKIALVSMVSVVMLVAAAFLAVDPVMATDYTFGTENVDLGFTASQTNRDAEDGSFEIITEGDQHTDTNYTTSTETVTTGTAGGAALPGSIQDDDNNYRTYQEADTAGSATYQNLRPTSDGSVTTMVEFPVSPTTHYDKVDETTAGGDGDTTYLEGVTNGQESELGMGDASDPGGTNNIDVTMWQISRGETTSQCTLVWGIEIGGVEYQGGSTNMLTITYTNYSYTWTVDPSDSQEWSLSEVNALQTYIRVTDANPDTRTTQIALRVTFTPAVAYKVEAKLTYSTSAIGETQSWMLLVQAKKSNTENFYVQLWDYTGSSWATRITVNSVSDTDYSYTLTSTERSGGGEVQSRVIGATEPDSVQDTVSFDIWKVQRIDTEYMSEVRWTATGVPSSNIDLKWKGYSATPGEWLIQFWNYTTSGWDTKWTETHDTNTLDTFAIYGASYVSSGEMKVRLENTVTLDITKTIFYLDWLVIRAANIPPTISQFGHQPADVNVGETLYFYCIYTDADDDAPSYVRAVINTVNYAMTKNNSGDTIYTDGCAYYLDKADLPRGSYTYYYAVKDATNPEVTSSPSGDFLVNAQPTLTQDTVTPLTGNNGDEFIFCVIYTDDDNDAPASIKAVIDATEYTMEKNNTGDTTYTDGCAYHYHKTMAGGSHTYYYKTSDWLGANVQTGSKGLTVNNKPSLSSPTFLPSSHPFYVTTQLTFGITYTDADNELPSQIHLTIGTTDYDMAEVVPGDTNVVDGKLYQYLHYSGHGIFTYHFNTSDGNGGWAETSTYDYWVDNRPPEITYAPDDPWILDRDEELEYTECLYDEPDYDHSHWSITGNGSFSGGGWLFIGQNSGIFLADGGSTPNTPGWWYLNITLNDLINMTDTYNFIVQVVNQAPVITSSGNTSQGYLTFMAYHVTYSDGDNDEITLGFSTNATWLSLTDEWVNGTATPVGWYEVTVWANDSYGGSDNEHWHLTVSNQAPYFTSTPIYTIANQTYYEYDANATDPEAQAIVYTMASNCTPLQIGATNGTVWGIPSLVGSYYINVTATDDVGAFGYQNFTLSVTNTAPIFTSTPTNVTLFLGIPWAYDCNATDANDDILYYDLVSPTPGFLFIDHATGMVEGSADAYGTWTVRISVWDGYVTIYQQFEISCPNPEEEIPPNPPNEPEPPSDFALIMVMFFSLVTVIMIWRAVVKMQGGKKKEGAKK